MLSNLDTYLEALRTSPLEFLLTLTPAQRLRRHDAALALVRAAREAGIRYHGFDPRSPEAA